MYVCKEFIYANISKYQFLILADRIDDILVTKLGAESSSDHLQSQYSAC